MLHKFKLIKCCALAVLLCSCATAPANREVDSAPETTPDSRLALLEATYEDLFSRIEAGQLSDSLKPFLTDSSLLWVDEMEVAAISESRNAVEARPFNELMTIILYRMLERDNRMVGFYKDRMLSLAIGKNGVLRKIRALKLGPMEVRNLRGTRGLSSSPRVPIIYFTWIDGRWKLDLKATLPVITRGIETIGVKKEWSQSKTILYLLEKQYRNQLKVAPDESLLDPGSPQ
jgi:hypothetical protein